MRRSAIVMCMTLAAYVALAGPATAAPPASGGKLAPMPPSMGDRPRAATAEFCASNADLIIVGKVVKKADPRDIEFMQPYADEPARPRYAVACEVEIERVIFDRLGDARLPATGPAASAPAATGTAAAGRRAVSVLMERPEPGVENPKGFYYLDLIEGRSYVLFLQKIATSRYYLPARTACAREADEKSLALAVAAADFDKWPWGRPVNGLQLAVIASPLPYADTPDGAGTKGGRRYMLSFALRNKADQPISLNIYATDVTTTAVARDETGHEVKMPQVNTEHMSLPRRNPASSARLDPGQIVFFDRFGRTDGTSWSSCVELIPGKWTITASAEFKRPPEGHTDVVESAWIGSLEAGAVSLTVAATRPATK